ncbi:hypothetical protein RUM44_012275 [Polyplax serrata]|uniref:Potassium channel domain-containing protein n=1 Tax=Polyplax serrata TaxID=468196 RepID=A0ABR1BCQ5_POLSC
MKLGDWVRAKVNTISYAFRYGHIAPKTHWGKVVTILYAILGIPLMLLCLSNIGDVMAHSFRFIYWRVCCYMCTRKPKRVPSRRGRSTRSTMRSSGRYSGRYRSFKQQASTKSADSALALSEAATRSSYSDTECRYNDTELNGDRPVRSPPYRYSETVATTHAGDIMTPQSPHVRPHHDMVRGQSVIPDYGRTEMYDPMYLQTPVLFNKYAIDKNDSMRAHAYEKHSQGSHTLPRQHQKYYEDSTQQQASPYGGSLRRSAEHERASPHAYQSHPPRSTRRAQTSSSPRIMSPMGFAVARHTNYRPSRLGRLREDGDFDGFELDDYDYDANSSSQAAKIKPVPIWLCVFLVVSYIFGGAFLFSEWENWHFLDSAYFCFITLTTIGFGDFVPAQRVQKNAEISIALCSLYLLFGIALLAMSFNLVQEEVINNVKAIAKRLGVIKEDDDDDM